MSTYLENRFVVSIGDSLIDGVLSNVTLSRMVTYKQGPPGVIPMGPPPMSKSVRILDDGEDKNRERDEAKAQVSGVCVWPAHFMLDVLPLYNEKGCRVILNLLSTLSFDST